MAHITRVDKNGTEYWVDNTCPKCGGSGNVGIYWVEGGKCFHCGGTGCATHTWKVYTEEYAKKLADRRLEKARKQSEETNRNFISSLGMNEDGKFYVVAVKNTYDIKDELKNKGAKCHCFCGKFYWTFDHKEDNTFEISIDDIAQKNENTYCYQLFPEYVIDEILSQKLDEIIAENNKATSISEYIGNVGDKITINVKFVDKFVFDSHYSYYGSDYIYKFVDENGNDIVWKTNTYHDELEVADYVTITATIKEHKEYKGVKQTSIIRAKKVG